MKNLIFMFLILATFFGCEDEEASKELNLVGNWNVNIEIYIASTECSGTPEVFRSGTVVFTDTTLIISLNSYGDIYDINFDYTLNSSKSEITMMLGDDSFIGSMELNENSATFDMVIDFDDDENAYCEKWNLTRID